MKQVVISDQFISQVEDLCMLPIEKLPNRQAHLKRHWTRFFKLQAQLKTGTVDVSEVFDVTGASEADDLEGTACKVSERILWLALQHAVILWLSLKYFTCSIVYRRPADNWLPADFGPGAIRAYRFNGDMADLDRLLLTEWGQLLFDDLGKSPQTPDIGVKDAFVFGCPRGADPRQHFGEIFADLLLAKKRTIGRRFLDSLLQSRDDANRPLPTYVAEAIDHRQKLITVIRQAKP